MNPPSENNPIRHTQKTKAQMRQLIDHLRENIGKVTEAKARALFESSSEVVAGLVKAFDDYEKKGQEAWQTELMASLPKGRTLTSPGEKSSYIYKHIRQMAPIETGGKRNGDSTNTGQARVWTTVNKRSGGGKKAAALVL